MSEPIVGSIGVAVVPDASGFRDKAERDLVPGMAEIGDQLGRAVGSHMSDSLSPYLDEIRAKLDALGLKDVNVKVKVDDDGSLDRAAGKVAAVDSAAGSSGGGFSLMGGKILGIGLAALSAADIAIPALLAIGAAAGGALAGIGVGILGFSGIPEALQAHGQSTGGGGGGASGANSQLGLQSAQINATQATQSANDQLTQATQAQTKAETDLHNARVQALQDLQDLDNKLKDNTLSQQQAAIDLDNAKKTLALTLASPGAGLSQYADQVKQAQLNVATAQQKLNETTLDGTRLQQQDATAHAQGVEQNPSVVAAKQTLADANKKLAEAQTNVTVTAEKNAIALQQAGNSAASAAGGVDAFQQAMAKLNPLQQQFVDFLLTLQPLFDQLKTAASEFLPGLEAGIKNALPAFQPILGVVSTVATALGDSLNRIFSQFNTPAGQKFIAFLTSELPKQIGFLTTLFIDFGQIFASVWEAAGPLIDAVDKAILGFFSHVNASAAGSGLSSFFASLIPLVPKITQALTALSGLIGSVLKALAPALGPVLDLITNLANGISGLVSGPVGQMLVQTFVDFVNALEPLIPLLANLISTILPPLEQGWQTLLTQGIAPFIAAVSKDLQPLLPVLGGAITQLVQAIAPLEVQFIQALLPVLPKIVTLFIQLLNGITPLITPIANLLSALTPLVGPLTDISLQMFKLGVQLLPVIAPLITAICTVLTPFVKLLAPVVDMFDKITTAIDNALNKLLDFNNHLPGVHNGELNIPGVGSIQVGTHVIAGVGSTGPSAPQTHGTPQTRAIGGPVLAGHLYRVNEQSNFGPESFIPQVNGQILNAADTARLKSYSNQTRNNYFNIVGSADPVGIAHAVANRLAVRAAV